MPYGSAEPPPELASAGVQTVAGGRGDRPAGGRLFGRLCGWRRRYPLGDFAAVTCRRVVRVGENDTVFVGLRRNPGRVMEVSYFNRRSDYSQAWGVASPLAEATGLPLEEMKS